MLVRVATFDRHQSGPVVQAFTIIMAPTNTSKKDTKKAKSSTTKKEKVFHPDSRKADQLNRKVVRKERMGGLTKKRKTRSYETGTIVTYRMYLLRMLIYSAQLNSMLFFTTTYQQTYLH